MYNAKITITISPGQVPPFRMTTESSDDVPEVESARLQLQYLEMLAIGLADVIAVNCDGKLSTAKRMVKRVSDIISDRATGALAEGILADLFSNCSMR